MFSFFRRNKAKPTNNDKSNKSSLNMQLAIERQQASLHQTLELKRKIDVNDREQNVDVNSHTASASNDEADRVINSPTAPPSAVSDYDKSNVRPSSTCAGQKHQNFDQYRDATRSSYSLYDSIEYASRQGNTPSTPSFPINYYQPSEKLSPTVVASSITDQKCSSTIAGTSLNSAYNSVDEVMGRGRNRNKHRGPTFPQNPNNKSVKSQRNDGDDEISSPKNVNDSREVTSENSNANSTNFEIERSPEPPNLNISASAVENSEKSASISCENVFRDETSCSIISPPENKNDNIATSDEEKTASAREATNIVSAHDEENGNLVESVVASGVKNDEHSVQQVGAPLQRNPSARRVTFAPSPPRSLATSLSDDDEDTTLSDDIFYEATEAPSDTQKLRILSTVTSHSSDCSRIDEETSEVDASTSSSIDSSSSNFNNNHSDNDLVCAKIILSVNENEKSQPSDNDDYKALNIKNNAFSSSDSSISSHAASAPKTIKPSYCLVGDDTLCALPDIVAETSLYEHHADEM